LSCLVAVYRLVLWYFPLSFVPDFLGDFLPLYFVQCLLSFFNLFPCLVIFLLNFKQRLIYSVCSTTLVLQHLFYKRLFDNVGLTLFVLRRWFYSVCFTTVVVQRLLYDVCFIAFVFYNVCFTAFDLQRLFYSVCFTTLVLQSLFYSVWLTTFVCVTTFCTKNHPWGKQCRMERCRCYGEKGREKREKGLFFYFQVQLVCTSFCVSSP
jgi:hypothetical protein